MNKPAASPIIEFIFRPDVLFTIATFQGLSPYLFWPLGVGLALPSSELSYLPALISICGWLSFVFGASLVWAKVPPEVNFSFVPHKATLKTLIWLGIAVGVVQIYFTAKVYGSIPILSYLQGNAELNAGKAIHLQQDSFVGQIALINLTTTLLGALLLALAVVALEMKKKVTMTFYFGLLASIMLSLFNAKRIGMVRIFSLLISGLLLYDERGFANITVLLPFAKSKKAAVSTLLGVLFVEFAIFGPIAELRNPGGAKTSSVLQVVSYQEDVILNMEEQTSKAGLGPYQFRLFAPFNELLPNKLAPELSLNQIPAKVDLSSPNGFYELLHWYWGPVGCLIFPALIGALCMWLYRRIRSGGAYLFCYAYIVVSLLLAHSFNEFFIAPIVLVPWLCFMLMAKWLSTTKKKVCLPNHQATLRTLRLRRL